MVNFDTSRKENEQIEKNTLQTQFLSKSWHLVLSPDIKTKESWYARHQMLDREHLEHLMF